MQRAPIVAGAALAAIATSAVLAVGAGGQEPPATGIPDFTVTTTIRDRDGFQIDNPPRRRESPGDVFGGYGRISGAKTGSLSFTCTATPRAVLCSGVSAFPDGEVHLSARFGNIDARVTTIAIVGGTGAYNGAKGTLTSRETSSRRGTTVSEDTYDFVP